MNATEQNPKPGVSKMLRVRLREDACLRAHARQLQAALEATHAAANQAKHDAGLFPRLLHTVIHSKAGRHTPVETAQIFSKEEAVQEQCRAEERVLQHYTEDLNTLITVYLQETMPVFFECSMARKRLGGWENAVKALQADLHGLLRALGQARNAATSGYNSSKHIVSTTAQEQFGKAIELARSVEANVKLTNEQARELGGLPEIAAISCENVVKSLPGLDIGPMQKEFERLTHELESFEKEQLAGLLEPVVQAAVLREKEALAYLEQYREELREFSDRQLKPEELARAIPEILARQSR